MAAPRLYSDAQREAMFRLYEAGKSPAEIAQLCEQGTAGCSPFTIPRRTCHDIVTRMAEEAERKLPTSVAEAESADAVERYPMRIAGIVDAEIDRIEAKQKSRGLTPEDYDRLRKAADLSHALHKRLNQRRSSGSRGARGTRQGTGSQPRPESVLERLAREEEGGVGGRDHPSPTCSSRDDGDSTAEDASDALAGVSQPAAADAAETAEALARKSPAERAEIQRRAQAALGFA